MKASGSVLTILAALAMPSWGSGPWLDLDPRRGPAQPLVELDVSSIRQGLVGPEAVIRVTPGTLLRHEDLSFPFGSWRMHLAFRCPSQRLEPLAVSFFTGARAQGLETEARTNLGMAGIPEDLLQVLSAPVLRSLLRAACRRDSVLHR